MIIPQKSIEGKGKKDKTEEREERAAKGSRKNTETRRTKPGEQKNVAGQWSRNGPILAK